MTEWLYFWLGVIVVTLVIEIITVGLTSIWLTGGALVALVVCGLHVPWWLQLVVFFVVSFVLIYFTRPWALKYLESRKTITNYEEAIGKEVRVLEQVDNHLGTGKAMYNGIEWTARAEKEEETFAVDEQAKVVAVQGVKLILAKVAPEPEEM
jgi:membrane protein implicated in regulation of membrane protease activity